MRIIVLGSAAGGGFPQWNCACRNCVRARSGDPAAKPRTQSSLAVSADGERWFLLNASPDLRQQILANTALYPRSGPRDSPIAGVVLTNADVDHIAGLLSLREGHSFALYATARVHAILQENRIFDVLAPELVTRERIELEKLFALGPGSGLLAEPFPVPGKVALYLEDPMRADFCTEVEDAMGLRISEPATGAEFFYVPACAAVTPELKARLSGAQLLFFDGTLWQDDEMIQAGLSAKTGRRMGHVSLSGEAGSLAAFEDSGIARRIFIHINNSNPILLEDSPERAAVEAAGWEVAFDGMEIRL